MGSWLQTANSGKLVQQWSAAGCSSFYHFLTVVSTMKISATPRTNMRFGLFERGLHKIDEIKR